MSKSFIIPHTFRYHFFFTILRIATLPQFHLKNHLIIFNATKLISLFSSSLHTFTVIASTRRFCSWIDVGQAFAGCYRLNDKKTRFKWKRRNETKFELNVLIPSETALRPVRVKRVCSFVFERQSRLNGGKVIQMFDRRLAKRVKLSDENKFPQTCSQRFFNFADRAKLISFLKNLARSN